MVDHLDIALVERGPVHLYETALLSAVVAIVGEVHVIGWLRPDRQAVQHRC